jgi:hypothetical protein
MTAVTLTPVAALAPESAPESVRRQSRVAVLGRRTATAVVIVVTVASAWTHRQQLGAGFHLLGHLSWGWLPAALVFQGASVVDFALLQRRLLVAGHVNISATDMTKISVAANAISASLPGGAAWSAPWTWRQLRRRGADRPLATWVVLGAGVLSSLALFVIVVAGVELAGDHGPVASLRWLARGLAAIVVMACALLWAAGARHRRQLPSDGRLVRAYERIRVVRLSPGAWAGALVLALANWLLDMACLMACVAAIGAPIDWRDVVVVYALTQLIAVLPLTPGGLGVVEAGLTALLVSYGTPAAAAIATVVLYRALTFWTLVPAGWAMWWQLERRKSRGELPANKDHQIDVIPSAPDDRRIGPSRREYDFQQDMLPYKASIGGPEVWPVPGQQIKHHTGV